MNVGEMNGSESGLFEGQWLVMPEPSLLLAADRWISEKSSYPRVPGTRGHKMLKSTISIFSNS